MEEFFRGLKNKPQADEVQATEITRLEDQLRVQQTEIDFLRSRQEHLRQLAESAGKERDTFKVQLQQLRCSGSGGNEELMKARNGELENEVAELRRQLANRVREKVMDSHGDGTHSHGTHSPPGPGGALLGIGRQLNGSRRTSITSARSYRSGSGSQGRYASVDRLRSSRSESVERLMEEKGRTEALIAKTEAARDATPPRERQRLDSLMGKLGKLHDGIEDKIAGAMSASSSPATSCASSRPQIPTHSQPGMHSRGLSGGLSSCSIKEEQDKMAQLQAKFRESSPNMSFEERRRMEGLMARLKTTHDGLNVRAQRLSHGDPEL